MQQIKIKYHEVDGKQTPFLKQVKDGDYIDLYTVDDAATDVVSSADTIVAKLLKSIAVLSTDEIIFFIKIYSPFQYTQAIISVSGAGASDGT